jgi:hypothetical protein
VPAVVAIMGTMDMERIYHEFLALKAVFAV